MFNYEILYLIGFIILALGLTVGVVFFMKKYKINSQQLTEGIDMAKTISTIIKITAKELNFANDGQVDKMADITIDALNYIKTITNATTKEAKVEAGIKYVEEVSSSFGIDMNEDRTFVAVTLLQLGINLLESLEVK
jgi:hypothetical protein